MKVVRRFFFLKLLYWNSTLYVFLNLQRDQNSAHFLYLFGDFLIFDVSTFEYISLLSRIQCFMKKYWFWGKNMFYVHIILKLCFILSWNGRPNECKWIINIWKLGLDLSAPPWIVLYNSPCIKLLELHRHKPGPSRTTNCCIRGQRYTIYNIINRGCKILFRRASPRGIRIPGTLYYKIDTNA